MKPVRLDRSARSLLAWCGECPPWREMRGTRPDALRAAATHLDQVHGQAKVAARLRDKAATLERDTPN